MEILLLAIYSFFVWLIFKKLKWIPWNITSQVIVIVIPVVSITILILFLNIYAPSSHDVRVVNYTIEIIPTVTGQVIEVPVEPNTHVKQGDVLFKIDPVPFENEIRNLEARIPALQAKIESAKAYDRELEAQVNTANERIGAMNARYELAKKRYVQTKALAESGAGSKFDFEQAETDLKDLEGQMAVVSTEKVQVLQRMSATASSGELSEIAQARADLAAAKIQIEDAKWKLSQTTFYAPSAGRVINLQLRKGSMASQLPLKPVMSFVEDEQWVIAMYHQNELRLVNPGNEAEIALHTYPNKIVKCEVESIVWATGQGQIPMSGMIPQSGTIPAEAGRFAVRLKVAQKDKNLFLAPGAMGMGAIFTNHGKPIHLVRKVILRVGSKMDWLVLKLH